MELARARALIQGPGQIATEIYRELDLKLTYDHESGMITAEAALRSSCVASVSEGGLEPPRPIKGTSTSS
ncbi:hypothetical protein FAGKG844_10350 [Frankia sp. AgKG'84/4]